MSPKRPKAKRGGEGGDGSERGPKRKGSKERHRRKGGPRPVTNGEMSPPVAEAERSGSKGSSRPEGVAGGSSASANTPEARAATAPEPMLMPVQPQSPVTTPNRMLRTRGAGGKDSPTWPGLEASKARLAAAMDRCEFLAGARTRFAEVSAQQADVLRRRLRPSSSPNLHAAETLHSSVEDMRKMLDDQCELLTSSRTVWKRLDSLHQFVISKEGEYQGMQGAEAAKKSSSTASPPSLKDTYKSPYNEIYAQSLYRGPSLWPTMAVKTAMPYSPPSSALSHGKRYKDAFLSGTLGSTSGSLATND